MSMRKRTMGKKSQSTYRKHVIETMVDCLSEKNSSSCPEGYWQGTQELPNKILQSVSP